MSPEQARGKIVDRRADVWAFGCVVYEMLAGRQAFPNGETVSDTTRVARDDFIAPRHICLGSRRAHVVDCGGDPWRSTVPGACTR